MADPVLLLLHQFDGSQDNCDLIVEAVQKMAIDIARDDPFRDRVDIFIGNVIVSGFGVRLGSSAKPLQELLIAEWKPLAATLVRGYWLH